MFSFWVFFFLFLVYSFFNSFKSYLIRVAFVVFTIKVRREFSEAKFSSIFITGLKSVGFFRGFDFRFISIIFVSFLVVFFLFR